MWQTEFKIGPHDPCLLVFMPLYIPYYLESGQDMCLASNQHNMANLMGFHFYVALYKALEAFFAGLIEVSGHAEEAHKA